MNSKMESAKLEGSAAAAVLAAAVGVLLIGLLTILAEVSNGLKAALAWYGPAGPLTGKTGGGVIAWLVVWSILHFSWRHKEVNFSRLFFISTILVAIGWLLTFPLVFEVFSR